MMKTPEEIKRGRDCCANCADLYDGCSPCPYSGEKLICYELQIDALAYIQQLEQDNSQKDERIRQLERERDQALHDMCNIYGSICLVCKNFYRPDKTVLKFACKEFGELRNHGSTVFCGKFEWRGVEEDDHGENR